MGISKNHPSEGWEKKIVISANIPKSAIARIDNVVKRKQHKNKGITRTGYIRDAIMEILVRDEKELKSNENHKNREH